MTILAKPAISAATMVAIVCTTLSACSANDNPLLGRVEATVAGHEVVVKGCYTTHLAPVQSGDDGDRWTPCKDAAVIIKDDMLYVNGSDGVQLSPSDAVLVENGKGTVVPR